MKKISCVLHSPDAIEIFVLEGKRFEQSFLL